MPAIELPDQPRARRSILPKPLSSREAYALSLLAILSSATAACDDHDQPAGSQPQEIVGSASGQENAAVGDDPFLPGNEVVVQEHGDEESRAPERTGGPAHSGAAAETPAAAAARQRPLR